MKTVLTDMTLIDALVVCKGVAREEKVQIEAFTGLKFDEQNVAMSCMNAPGHKFAARVKETGEPLVVGGFIPVGPTVFRTYMLATERGWAEHGVEITRHVIKAFRFIEKNQAHTRIETLCLASREKAQDWYKRIGMHLESQMPGYGASGERAVLYVRVKGAVD